MRDTKDRLLAIPFPPLARRELTTLQVNIGYRCNQSCVHCHVGAGPGRTEAMDDTTIAQVQAVLARGGITTLDITGGAPELHPRFRDLVRFARARNIHVIDRCNLTILHEDGQEDLADFLGHEGVEVVASLPCYLEDNVDAQRGRGVFDGSLKGLALLNARGYGTSLPLTLVYNPQGPGLPPSQEALEADYRVRLGEYGIVFTRLFALANMPIQRFGATLLAKDRLEPYLVLLQDNHMDTNLAHVMCRDLISVDWRGNLYDCDFNQALAMPCAGPAKHLHDLLAGVDVTGAPIAVAGHCYGCTAGQGSSCGGSLAGQ